MTHRRLLTIFTVAFAALLAAPVLAQEPTPPADTTALAGLHVVQGDGSAVVEIGSLDDQEPYKMRVGLERGAIYYIHLTDYLYRALSDPLDPNSHYRIATKLRDPGPSHGWHRPFAAVAVTINGQRVSLAGAAWQLDEHAPDRAVYAATILNSTDQPVLEIRRAFILAQDSYELECRQNLINRTDQPLDVVFEQYGQTDAPEDRAKYMGDQRLLVAGYFDLEWNPSGTIILAEKTYTPRTKRLDAKKPKHLWPNENVPAGSRLAWLASMNRYFALALSRPVDIPAGAQPDGTSVPRLDDLFSFSEFQPIGEATGEKIDTRDLILTLRTKTLQIDAGDAAPVDLALFAGPRKPQLFEQPAYRALHFDGLIQYSLGGCCTFMTFQWLAKILLGFMTAIDFVTADWGVAIIILVLVVRLVLHPLTKRSQIHMTKLSKQMATLQPEIQKLKTKYENDSRRFQAEQAKLFREKGVNPVSIMGCAPMFLQMPIWIALYAMLFLAIELRHQPAFWGVFQWVSDGKWLFLSDLSDADKFIQFTDQPYHLTIPVLNMLDLSSLNILPILMGVMMYLQQKFMSPPPANEQARQQQKMMSVMFFMFPLFLYSAPSGLTLYILASTSAGMLDSYLVRKHIREHEEAGTLFDKKPAKPGGWRDRIGKYAAAKRDAMGEQQKRLTGGQTKSRYQSRRKR